MPKTLHIVAVDLDQVDKIYPLIQARRPDMSVSDLKSALKQFDKVETEKGLLAFENKQHYLMGFCTYNIVEDALDGRILFVNHFIPMDVMGRYNTAAIMIQAIEDKARGNDCRAIHVNLHDAVSQTSSDASPTIRNLSEMGHCLDGLKLRKAIQPAAG